MKRILVFNRNEYGGVIAACGLAVFLIFIGISAFVFSSRNEVSFDCEGELGGDLFLNSTENIIAQPQTLSSENGMISIGVEVEEKSRKPEFQSLHVTDIKIHCAGSYNGVPTIKMGFGR